MHAVVLAAGFGTRVGGGAPTCKALMPVGCGNAIDLIVGQLECHTVRTIHVVHNTAHAELFRCWKDSLRSDSFSGLPYVRLHNDHARSVEERLGAVGSLHSLLIGLDTSLGLILSCVDTPWTFSTEHFISEARGDVTICLQRASRLMSPELYGCVDLDYASGTVVNFYEKKFGAGCDHVWLGPVVFSSSVRDYVREYVDERRALGKLPDNLGDFIAWLLIARRADVHGWIVPEASHVWDLGDRVGLLEATAFYRRRARRGTGRS